jgi:hypothetical protein
MIEYKCAGQHPVVTHSHLQLIAQLDRTKRVYACLHQRRIGSYGITSLALHHIEYFLKINHNIFASARWSH